MSQVFGGGSSPRRPGHLQMKCADRVRSLYILPCYTQLTRVVINFFFLFCCLFGFFLKSLASTKPNEGHENFL